MKRYDDQRLSDIDAAITAIRAHLARGELSDGLVLAPLLDAVHRLQARVSPKA